MKESTRFLHLEDLFTITCRKCGSIDVDLSIDECHECGSTITAECNACDSKYKYHDFKQIKVWYDKKGKEIKNELDEEKVC